MILLIITFFHIVFLLGSCTDCPDGFFKDVNGSMPCKLWKK